MQHFANFGYVKQANKQLKKLNEMSTAVRQPNHYLQLPISLGEQADYFKMVGQSRKKEARSDVSSRVSRLRESNKRNPSKIDSYTANPKIYGDNRTMLRGENRGVQETYGDIYRQRDAIGDKTMPQKPPMRKPKSSEELEIYDRKIKGEPDFNSFTEVRVNSDPAIEGRYLGFRKDPYKGYGGMMEEPVDILPSNKKLPKARIRY